MMVEPIAKPLFWIASSRRDMQAMPVSVRRSFGYDLFAVQCGETPPSAKSLKGFGGAGVLELIEDDRGGTYRAVYTVRFRGTVYALHVFQKKSKRGIATPAHEIELIRGRLKLAEIDYSMRKEELDP
jgi:phage-related protein